MKTIDVEIMDISVKIKNSELKLGLQIIEQRKIGNKYELKVTLKDKVYHETYYNHQLQNVAMDKTLKKRKAQGLQIVGWMLTKDQ